MRKVLEMNNFSIMGKYKPASNIAKNSIRHSGFFMNMKMLLMTASFGCRNLRSTDKATIPEITIIPTKK